MRFCAQDSNVSNSYEVDIFVANNSLHILGDAKISGNINFKRKDISIKGEFTYKKKSKVNKNVDNVDIIKKKSIQQFKVLQRPKHFFQQDHNIYNFCDKNFNRSVFIANFDSQEINKSKCDLVKTICHFRNKFEEKEIVVENFNYSATNYFFLFENIIEARPPPYFA